MNLVAGVMGDPVALSLSPRLHRYWLKRYQIEGEYRAMHVPAENLKEALEDLIDDGHQGCNLTIPHKEAALRYMDQTTYLARRIGAVNTITVQRDGSLHGTNTDAYGFIENLRQHMGNLMPYLEHCLILGAGGAAKAVYTALKDEGAKRISISNRNRSRAEAFDATVIDWEIKDQMLTDVSLLVNTTSLGMRGGPELTLSLDRLPLNALVSDVVYQPLITPLLQQARQRGNQTVTGLGMLIHQAIPGFESWFGVRPAADEDTYYQFIGLE